MTCAARHLSDMMVCTPCGMQWDMNDPDEPLCPKQRAATIPPTTDEPQDRVE